MDVTLHVRDEQTYAAEGLDPTGVVTLVVPAEAIANRRARYELEDDAAALAWIVREHAERIHGSVPDPLVVTVDETPGWTPPPPAPDPAVEAQRAARRAAIANVLNNDSVLVAGKEPERDSWCMLLGCQPLSTLDPPIPSTQAVTVDDIVLLAGT